MKGLVWVNRNPDKGPESLDATVGEALPGFMGPPTCVVWIHIPRWLRLLRFWGRWKNIAIDTKAVYEVNGGPGAWPPKPNPRYEDTSRFLEIMLV
jgi:hypothetical protein